MLPDRRGGFTLIEIVIATTVMALMVVSLLSFVSFGSDIWQRGEQAMNLTNSYRGIAELITSDMMGATALRNPVEGGGVATFLEYDLTIASGPTIGTATFQVQWDSPTRTLRRKIMAVPAPSAAIAAALVPTVADESTSTKIARTRYEFIIARNVATFAVTRLSNWTVAVQVGLQSVEFNSSDTAELCATNTFLAAGAI
ncbi:MAG: prepilin-type N-terminal cleavage/methylation domain-containing protein [Candidatus Riflebacteria bacterium]|nr:prepilin-type N-terminal cleavage/methylation domain-containing protein [Candidatus Riflebacteria bacterium]